MSEAEKSSVYLSVGVPNCTADFVEQAISVGTDGLRLIAKGANPEEIADVYNQTAEKFSDPRKVLLDLPGTKPRLAPDVQITIEPEQVIAFTSEESSSEGLLGTRNLARYVDDIHAGNRLLINDGSYVFEVAESNGTTLEAKLLNEQPITLTPNRSINLPDSPIKYEPLSEADERLLRLLAKQPNLAVAISMVGTAADLERVKSVAPNAIVVPKIETQVAVSNLDELIKATRPEDGVMLARGDLSIELSPTEIVRATRLTTEMCREYGRKLFLATWILESLATSDQPTPDNISDLLYFHDKGVRDFVISGGPATKKPLEAVNWLRKILTEIES
jgi:pyruvate kinase